MSRLAQSQILVNFGVLEPVCCRICITQYDVSLSFASRRGLDIIKIFFQTLKTGSYQFLSVLPENIGVNNLMTRKGHISNLDRAASTHKSHRLTVRTTE